MKLKVINQYMSASEQTNNGTGELYIYGDIVDEKWWDEEVSPKSVRDALDALDGAKNLDIHINSYGGSCVAGNAIISILDNYRRKNNATLNVYIEGIAASMGSGIASIGDKVYMADNALAMYHRPLTIAAGNADDFEKTIQVLQRTEETLISNYMRRFNGTEDELRQILADETWMTAEEAKEHGFVDEIIEGAKIAASAKGIQVGDQMFNQKVANMVKNKIPKDKIKKEEPVLTYDEKLKDFGITEDAFNGFNVEAETLLNIADIVKNSVVPEPVEQFVDKAAVLEALGCEDITSEQLIDYAKSGMNPVDTTEIQSKADAYDKVVTQAKSTALTSAIQAQGDSYNESRMKKFLDALTYEEILDQTDAWKKQAADSLNAGVRISVPTSAKNYSPEKEEKAEDYKF